MANETLIMGMLGMWAHTRSELIIIKKKKKKVGGNTGNHELCKKRNFFRFKLELRVRTGKFYPKIRLRRQLPSGIFSTIELNLLSIDPTREGEATVNFIAAAAASCHTCVIKKETPNYPFPPKRERGKERRGVKLRSAHFRPHLEIFCGKRSDRHIFLQEASIFKRLLCQFTPPQRGVEKQKVREKKNFPIFQKFAFPLRSKKSFSFPLRPKKHLFNPDNALTDFWIWIDAKNNGPSSPTFQLSKHPRALTQMHCIPFFFFADLEFPNKKGDWESTTKRVVTTTDMFCQWGFVKEQVLFAFHSEYFTFFRSPFSNLHSPIFPPFFRFHSVLHVYFFSQAHSLRGMNKKGTEGEEGFLKR